MSENNSHALFQKFGLDTTEPMHRLLMKYVATNEFDETKYHSLVSEKVRADLTAEILREISQITMIDTFSFECPAQILRNKYLHLLKNRFNQLSPNDQYIIYTVSLKMGWDEINMKVQDCMLRSISLADSTLNFNVYYLNDDMPPIIRDAAAHKMKQLSENLTLYEFADRLFNKNTIWLSHDIDILNLAEKEYDSLARKFPMHANQILELGRSENSTRKQIGKKMRKVIIGIQNEHNLNAYRVNQRFGERLASCFPTKTEQDEKEPNPRTPPQP